MGKRYGISQNSIYKIFKSFDKIYSEFTDVGRSYELRRKRKRIP